MPTLHRPLDEAIRKARRLKAALPEEVLTEHARLVALAEERAAPPREEFRAAYTACLDAGTDPMKDKRLVELAARCTLAGPEARQRIEAQARSLFLDHAEDIFAAFTDPFGRAADTLAEAFQSLGLVNLQRATATSRTPAVDKARLGTEVITQIIQLWKVFAMSGTTFPNPAHQAILVYADVPPSAWWELRPDWVREQFSAWDAVCLGFPLSLATPTTYRQRTAAIADAREAEEARLLAARRPEPTPPTRMATLLASW